MTLRITKEDYKLLISMYAESLNSIVLKKTFGVKVPDEYNYNSFINLQMKLYSQGEDQKLISENTTLPDQNLEELSNKIENEKISKKEIYSTLMKEFAKNDFVFELMKKMAQDIKDYNKNNAQNDIDR